MPLRWAVLFGMPGFQTMIFAGFSESWRCSNMTKKLAGKALAEFEAERDVWQEVLSGVKEIKAGGGKRTKVESKSHGVSVRPAERAEKGVELPHSASSRRRKVSDIHITRELLRAVASGKLPSRVLTEIAWRHPATSQGRQYRRLVSIQGGRYTTEPLEIVG